MMVAASAFILRVPADRRRKLLQAAEGDSYYGQPLSAEPVPAFSHSRNAPLVVLASFENGKITHIADGRKGLAAGTGLTRLNMTSMEALTTPLPFSRLLRNVPKAIRPHLKRAIDAGGVLPPKTFRAVVDALTTIDPSIAERLERYSADRRERIAALSDTARENLALQKETLAAALEIAGIDRDELLEWSPGVEPQASFLEGLPEAHVREDSMLATDFANLPGFDAFDGVTHVASKTFVNHDNPSIRVTVVMANRSALEQQTGADLIYYNEKYRSFVLVQYKALEKGNDEPEFRWKAGDKFMDEVARMDRLLAELAKIAHDADPDGYRFSTNPFFLKFCSRLVFNPDDKGLFKGMYLPLDLWKGLAAARRLVGPKGGNVLTYTNVGRRLSNSDFVTLVSDAWVGTNIPQSKELTRLIREILETGKTVTFAVKRSPPDDPDGSGVTNPIDISGLSVAKPEEEPQRVMVTR